MALIELALRQARRSRCRYRVGAVLASGSRVLAASPNVRRNNPMVDFLHATFHAEEAVLRQASGSKGRRTLYVARVDAAGRPALARPCRRCQDALFAAGVTRVHYTTSVGTVDSVKLSGAPAGPQHWRTRPLHVPLQDGWPGSAAWSPGL
ncbi:hypothetical protein [Streptomyces sp. NPDC056632]|uniref:hypothetical protein n=1 Tax=Streptomyces sp. NPDC056632 TaxID=3345884 RepID=UPI0036C0C812